MVIVCSVIDRRLEPRWAFLNCPSLWIAVWQKKPGKYTNDWSCPFLLLCVWCFRLAIANHTISIWMLRTLLLASVQLSFQIYVASLKCLCLWMYIELFPDIKVNLKVILTLGLTLVLTGLTHPPLLSIKSIKVRSVLRMNSSK
jgi:hypothetical protein